MASDNVMMVVQITENMHARLFSREGEAEGIAKTVDYQCGMVDDHDVRICLSLRSRPTGARLLPKPERVQVPEYRLWLATQPCCACRGSANKGRPAAACIVGHHLVTGGMGTKGSDLIEIPLCTFCHQLVHVSGITALAGKDGMEWAWHQAVLHLGRWLTEVVLVQQTDGHYSVPQVPDEAKVQKMRAALEAAVGAGDAAYHALVTP